MHALHPPYVGEPGGAGKRRSDGEARSRALAEPPGARRRSVLSPRRRGPGRYAGAYQSRAHRHFARGADRARQARARHLAGNLPLGASPARRRARALGARRRVKLSSALVGEAAGPLEQTIDARWVMAYSAGLGETDPRYYDTTAASGPWVHPLFPVCYEWPVSRTLRSLPPLEAHKARLIHAQHDLVLHRPLRADETLQTFARIALAAPRSPGAFVVFRFEARDAQAKPVTTSDFGVLYREVPLDGPARALLEVEDPPGPPLGPPKTGELP